MTKPAPVLMTSGAQVRPFDVDCHSGSLGRASSPRVHVRRSGDVSTWMSSVRSPVAYAYHVSPSWRMNGSGKLSSMTGFVNSPAATLGLALGLALELALEAVELPPGDADAEDAAEPESPEDDALAEPAPLAGPGVPPEPPQLPTRAATRIARSARGPPFTRVRPRPSRGPPA